ncbi:hypothetical protein IID21_00320 [Patescibacteria group bacterium]|nr:hypothetical protein [Patescibacteria group bacterium]
MKFSRNLLPFFLAVFFLSSLFPFRALAQTGGVGADGKTFEERKKDWLNFVPQPSSEMDMTTRRRYLFSWLEKGIYNNVVSESIQDFVGGYWLGGIRAQGGYAVMILKKYGQKGSGLISSNDESKIKNRYRRSIENSGFFGHLNPNKQVYAMVGTYLYTHYYENSLQFPVYGYPTSQDPSNLPSYYQDQWPTFSYGGRTYKFGSGPYNAQQLSRDWLLWAFDKWYVGKSPSKGPREFDSIDYARAFPGATALLWSLAPNSDQAIKTRAKMATDLLLLDSVLDFSANSWGGTMSRADYYWMGRSPIFPMHIYWGMGEDTDRFDVRVLYQVGYVPPDVIIDAGVLTDEADNYWYWHTEHQANGLLNQWEFGKWNFVTKNYNIGSNVGWGKRGWQVNVKGPGRKAFIRLWVNQDDTEPVSTSEGSHMGNKGRQFRNAIFADVGSQPFLWEKRVKTDWDKDEIDSGIQCSNVASSTWRCSGSGWIFRKKDKSMVAISLGAKTASAEVATEGVEYSNWNAFKGAVRANASLTTGSYTTSQGSTIGKEDYCGLNAPGDCQFPFERMNTQDFRGNKIVEWLAGDKMRVSLRGKTCTYDFSKWTYSGSCGEKVPGPTDTPTPTPSKVEGDLDGDGDVDIFDYNFLIENFGDAKCGNEADIDGNCKVDIFDYNILVENFGK